MFCSSYPGIEKIYLCAVSGDSIEYFITSGNTISLTSGTTFTNFEFDTANFTQKKASDEKGRNIKKEFLLSLPDFYETQVFNLETLNLVIIFKDNNDRYFITGHEKVYSLLKDDGESGGDKNKIEFSLVQTSYDVVQPVDTTGLIFVEGTGSTSISSQSPDIFSLVTNGENLGGGVGVFKQRVGTNLQFKTLVAGDNITISGGTDSIFIGGQAGGSVNAITGATNGLTKVFNKVVLGGVLTGTTSIDLTGSSEFNITNDGDDRLQIVDSQVNVEASLNVNAPNNYTFVTGSDVNKGLRLEAQSEGGAVVLWAEDYNNLGGVQAGVQADYGSDNHVAGRLFAYSGGTGAQTVELNMQFAPSGLSAMFIDGRKQKKGLQYSFSTTSAYTDTTLVTKKYVTDYVGAISGVTNTKFNAYTATTNTALSNRLLRSVFGVYTGTTVPATYVTKSIFAGYTGTTVPATYLTKSAFNTFSGTTLPANYVRKTIFNDYTGTTKIKEVSADNYAITFADFDYLIRFTSTDDVTITLDADAVNNKFYCVKAGAGNLSFTTSDSELTTVNNSLAITASGGGATWVYNTDVNIWYGSGLFTGSTASSSGVTEAGNGLNLQGGVIRLGYNAGTLQGRLTGDTYIISELDGNGYGANGVYFGDENTLETIKQFGILLPAATADTTNYFWITTYDLPNVELDSDLYFDTNNFSVQVGSGSNKNLRLSPTESLIGYINRSVTLNDDGITHSILSADTHTFRNGNNDTVIINRNSLRIPTGNTASESSLSNGGIFYNSQTNRLRGKQAGIVSDLINTGGTSGISVALFTGYTASTSTAINNRLLTSSFNSYSGTTAISSFANKTIFNSFTGTTVSRLSTIETNYVSGATNLGTGSGLYSTKTANKLNFKSLSGGTNVVLSATTNHIIVNALTGTDPELDYVEQSHFIFGGVGVTSGHVIDGWYVTSSGTGAGVGTDGTYVDSNEAAVGVCVISVGTTSTGRCRLNTGANSFIFGKGHTLDVTFRATLDALSTSAQTYTTIIGFCDTSTAAAQTDGLYFRYTHGTNSGRWECVNENNTTENAMNSGVSPTPGQMDVFRIVANAAGTSIAYYINGSLVATNTSQIPTSSGRNTALGCGMWKSVGNTERTLYVDYYKLKISRTTPM